MTDTVSPETRSRIMSRIRSENTAPEAVMAGILDGLGLRFECHPAGLRGRPDFVLRRERIAVFCDGDFWHGNSRVPDIPFWRNKIARNRLRDLSVNQSLRAKGWKVIRFWESLILSDPRSCRSALLVLSRTSRRS